MNQQDRQTKPVLKVAAIVVRQQANSREVLVFDHPLQDGGFMVQVPAGTIEPNEEPETAVIRELHEETGVHGKIDGLAGVIDEVFEGEQRRRWVYVLSPTHEVENRWDDSCDCGLPITCRWDALDDVELHELQMPWLQTGKDWVSRKDR